MCHLNGKLNITFKDHDNYYALKNLLQSPNKHNSFPHIKLMAESVLAELNKRWLDVKTMEYYPAFR
jgi:hypothetical protein